MTNEQFDILCKISGLHERAKDMRECSRLVFVDGIGVAEAAKGRGAAFYRRLWSQVKRIESVKTLCDSYCSR